MLSGSTEFAGVRRCLAFEHVFVLAEALQSSRILSARDAILTSFL